MSAHVAALPCAGDGVHLQHVRGYGQAAERRPQGARQGNLPQDRHQRSGGRWDYVHFGEKILILGDFEHPAFR